MILREAVDKKMSQPSSCRDTGHSELSSFVSLDLAAIQRIRIRIVQGGTPAERNCDCPRFFI